MNFGKWTRKNCQNLTHLTQQQQQQNLHREEFRVRIFVVNVFCSPFRRRHDIFHVQIS